MKWCGVWDLLPNNEGCGGRLGYQWNKIGHELVVVKDWWRENGAIILFSLFLCISEVFHFKKLII